MISCFKCRFYVGSQEPGVGTCHRNAPRPQVLRGEGRVDVWWPPVNDEDGCGEGQHFVVPEVDGMAQLDRAVSGLKATAGPWCDVCNSPHVTTDACPLDGDDFCPDTCSFCGGEERMIVCCASRNTGGA